MTILSKLKKLPFLPSIFLYCSIGGFAGLCLSLLPYSSEVSLYLLGGCGAGVGACFALDRFVLNKKMNELNAKGKAPWVSILLWCIWGIMIIVWLNGQNK